MGVDATISVSETRVLSVDETENNKKGEIEVTNKDWKNYTYTSPKEQVLDQFDFVKNFYQNEKWDNLLILHSRILDVQNNTITCECLIDKEKSIFENRMFPKFLFDHLPKALKNSYILINIKSRKGATRIDIFDGSKIVDRKVFESNEDWNDLDASDFNKVPDGPIIL